MLLFLCAWLFWSWLYILLLHERITDRTDLVCCSHCYIHDFWREIIFSRDVALCSASGRIDLVGSIWIPGEWINLNAGSRDWMPSMESVYRRIDQLISRSSMSVFSTGTVILWSTLPSCYFPAGTIASHLSLAFSTFVGHTHTKLQIKKSKHKVSTLPPGSFLCYSRNN